MMNEEVKKNYSIYAKAWLKFSKNELYLPEIVAYTPMSNKKESASIFKLREVKENAIFKVYPNPVKEVLTVAVETYEPTGILKVQLLNSLGTVVLQQRILVGITNINTSSLATGIYILRIMDGDKDVQKQTIEIIK